MSCAPCAPVKWALQVRSRNDGALGWVVCNDPGHERGLGNDCGEMRFWSSWDESESAYWNLIEFSWPIPNLVIKGNRWPYPWNKSRVVEIIVVKIVDNSIQYALIKRRRPMTKCFEVDPCLFAEFSLQSEGVNVLNSDWGNILPVDNEFW